MSVELKFDDARTDLETGIFVRARSEGGRWESVDISLLDAPSLREWLRSRGGENSWAESVVAILLGHDPRVPPWAQEVYISGISDANVLNSAWAKLYTADGEFLGEISPRHLLVALLEEMHTIDLHTGDGSEPVNISDAERLEFYIG